MSLITEADAFYRASALIDPERYVIADRNASSFSRALTKLSRDLSEDVSDPPWDQLIATARAARWRGATEPVPFHSKFSGAALPFAALLKLAIPLAGTLEPYRRELLDELLRTATAYLESGNEQYSDEVLGCLHDGDPDRTCLIVVGRRPAASVEGWLSELGETCPVLVPRAFMGGHRVWDLAIIAGAGAWLPPQLLTTPRADQMTLVHQDWIRDSQRFNGVFGEFATVSIRATIREPGRPTPAPEVKAETEEAAELLLKPDWSAVTASIPQAAPDDDLVEARLAVLSGGYGVLLPIGGDRIRGLDPSAPVGERVLHLKISSIVPGAMLLLRQGGTETSLMRALAVRELGQSLPRIQQLQDDWKSRLNQAISESSKAAVERVLRAQGAQTVNLAYWPSDECLRPQRDSDFEVLLGYLGIKDPGPYLAAGNELWRAHSKAGHVLARALEHQVERVDLTPLAIQGLQELHPDGAPDGATMTAFRVVGINDATFEVARHTTRRPFRTKGAVWLE
ncbi:MAG: hypothetical protein JWL97_3923 [Gemmatimonadales bacterium]|nr:hypothetical protein [Gemmatimonadales bacterium]